MTPNEQVKEGVSEPAMEWANRRKPENLALSTMCARATCRYPVLWDEDAIKYETYEDDGKTMQQACGQMPASHSSLGVHQYDRCFDPLLWVQAPCPLPDGGVPKGAHMLRITPCGMELYNMGTFCALIKARTPYACSNLDIVHCMLQIDIGGSASLVQGWAEIYPVVKSEYDMRSLQALPNSQYPQDVQRAAAAQTITASADGRIREVWQCTWHNR